jgi:hypothetical protein
MGAGGCPHESARALRAARRRATQNERGETAYSECQALFSCDCTSRVVASGPDTVQ